jgi:hypothetical protein
MQWVADVVCDRALREIALPAGQARPDEEEGMNALLADPVMRVFAVCTAILGLKILVTANYTGILRTSRRVESSSVTSLCFAKIMW